LLLLLLLLLLLPVEVGSPVKPVAPKIVTSVARVAAGAMAEPVPSVT
jgi:hypothetical protein